MKCLRIAMLLGMALLLGCQPFYRDAELRALRAADARRGDLLFTAARQEMDAGRPALRQDFTTTDGLWRCDNGWQKRG